MIEIRFHGRGGQGTVVASKALALAVAHEGKYVQTFPEYGVERRGAPVTAYTRIDDKPIYIRSKIYEPDNIVVLDPILVKTVNVTEGLKENGWVIINSPLKPDKFEIPAKFKVITADATSIALKYRLGSKASPIVNTAMLGIFAGITKYIGVDAVVEAVKEIAPVKVEENIEAAKEGYNISLKKLEEIHE